MKRWIHRNSVFFFFTLLFLTHLLASLSLFSPPQREWLWMSGTILAFVWMKQRAGDQVQSFYWPESQAQKPYSSWTWVVLLAAGIFLRSLRFWAIPPWPLLDETNVVESALKLNQHWDWSFFHNEGQAPPLLYWATGILFKVSHRSFFSLELPTFFFACVTLLAGFWAARRYLPTSLAFFSTAFLALSYWPVYLQAFSVAAITVLPWEIGVFFLLAGVLKKGCYQSRGLTVFFLGVWLGLGYWTNTSWPVVTFAALLLLFLSTQRSEWNLRIPFFLVAGLFSALFYFIVAALEIGGYGNHLKGYAALHGWVSDKKVLESALDYINSLFWGVTSEGSYIPALGGFLNPLLGAFFWMGIWEIFEGKSLPRYYRAIVPLILFFLLPGFLSQNLECLRVIQVLPLVLGLSALGACCFLSGLPDRGRRTLIGALILLSVSWDCLRWVATFKPWVVQTNQIRMVEGVLEKIAKDRGPGIILTQFKVQNHPQQGLSVHPEENLAGATFSFNAAENEELDFQKATWAALLIHSDEVAFLREELPGTQWWNPPVSGGGEEELSVGLIPIVPKERNLFDQWVQADRWFHKAQWEFLETSNAKTYQAALQFWENPPASFSEDRLVEASYGERLAEFYYYRGFETHYDLQVEALKRAITEGYPATHLNYDLGCLLLRKKNYVQSKQALVNALRSDPANPQVIKALHLLDQIQQENSPSAH